MFLVPTDLWRSCMYMWLVIPTEGVEYENEKSKYWWLHWPLCPDCQLCAIQYRYAKELDALKAQVKALKEMVEAANARHAAAVDPEEFNRIKIKVESAEDSTIASGFKGLKISGMVDPTYIYNKRAGDAGLSS